MPATLTAKFASRKGEQVADPLKLTLGKSTLEGRASLATDGARPFLRAKLSSPEIDLAQSPAAKGERRNGGRVFSDAPFPLEALRKFDADADLAVGRLVLPDKVPLETLKVRAVLKGGRLEVQPFTATVGGGPVSGRLVLDASRPKAPTLAVTLDGKGISMERIAAATGHAGTVTGGATDVAINLDGPGESLARFVGGGNGEVRIVVGAARASGAALDAGGGAITSILDKANPFRRTDPYTDIRCAVVRLPVRDGIATAQRTIAYETSKVNMVMAGTINLRTEALDLAVRPNVKEGIGIGAGALAELVRVTGTLSDPSVGIDTLGSARAALSVGGAILTGGLSLLGEAALAKATADPHPCQTALAGARRARRHARRRARRPSRRKKTTASSVPCGGCSSDAAKRRGTRRGRGVIPAYAGTQYGLAWTPVSAEVTAPRSTDPRLPPGSRRTRQNGMSSSISPRPARGRFLRRRLGASGRRSGGRTRRGLGRLALHARLARAAAAPEELHVVRHDLGGVAVLAVLVLPLPRPDAALDVDRRALLEVLARDLREARPEDDAVPLGLFLVLAALLVLPAEGRREADVGDRITVRHVAGFGVRAEVADQDHFVYRGHFAVLQLTSRCFIDPVTPAPFRPPRPPAAAGCAFPPRPPPTRARGRRRP